MVDLGPQFHGTTQEIRGDTLLPGGGPHGRPNYAHDFKMLKHSRQGVFTTPSEEEAWAYTTLSPDPGPGRPYVVKAQPSEDARRGIYGNEYISSSAKVIERHDIMPGRQGTFPGLNWAQFSRERNPSSLSYNHPSDAVVERGHVLGHFPPGLKEYTENRDAPEDPQNLRTHPRLF